MPRRGRCRCGTVLTFERAAHGYKVRCPSCRAVVRLRGEGAPPRPPAPTAPTDFETPALVEEYDVLEALLLRESSAPAAMAEMEAYREPKPARRGRWLVAVLAIAGVALAAGAVLVVLNNFS